MKRLLWLGVFLLSASWLFFIPQFTFPDLFLGTVLLLLGTFCMIGGLWRNVPSPVDITYGLLLVALVPVLLLIPFPYNLGFLVLSLGVLFLVLFNKRSTLQGIPFGLALSGAILVVQTLVFPLYVTFVSHGHRIDLLALVVSPLANLVGLQTSTNNGLLFLQTIQQNYAVTVTWEKLGCYLVLNMFLGGFFVFLMLSEKRTIVRNTFIFLIAGILFLLIRFIGLLALYQVTTDLSIFYDPFSLTLSFLPFALLLMKLLPLKNTTEQPLKMPSFNFSKKHLFALIMMFLFVFSVVTVVLYQDPGEMKNGRVLIDEYHSQWEDSTRPLDTDWYGLLSTYNYYSWARWLGYHYSVTTNTDTTLTAQLLDDYDILILKCPTQSYSTQEIQSITSFVERGGGVYLIGDHTNVFGMNTFLNQVSEEFGLRFKTDATYELGTGNLTIYTPDSLFSHPVIRHVSRFDFMTSCTLEPTSFLSSMRIEHIIIGNKIISEPGTYSTENFFRESIASADSEFGYLLQSAAIKYGRGRVVAFTDSTVFSSFCMFTDGYPSFTLGVMDYLNRTNSSEYLSIVLLFVIVLSLVSFLILLRKQKKIKVLWMLLFAGSLAFSVAAPLCFSLVDHAYPLPSAQQDYPSISFDQHHSSYDISLKPTASLGSSSSNYGTFFVWTQRVGYVPSVGSSLKEATTNSDVIVFINPGRSFIESELQSVTHYLESGGKVLLMDSIMNLQSTANELLGNFGMWIGTDSDHQQVFFNRTLNESGSEIGAIIAPYLTVAGGTPILLNAGNETYASMTEFRNETTGSLGTLVVVVDSYMFSDAVMGGTFTEPSEQQRRIYSTEFFLLDYILKK